MVDNQEEDSESGSIKKDKHKSDLLEPVLWAADLKIPKDEHQEEEIRAVDLTGLNERAVQKQHKNDVKRVCHVCGKTFNSGKALGGHTRIHVQESNKNGFFLQPHHPIKKQNPRESERSNLDFLKNKKRLLEANDTDDDDDDVKMTVSSCVVCGKDFPSMKSLSGHMRCHPERNWRGIQPRPPPPKVEICSSSSSLSDAEPPLNTDVIDNHEIPEDREVNLTESLKGWQARAWRGRKSGEVGVFASTSDISRTENEDEDDDGLKDAVNDLMMLARGKGVYSSFDHQSENSFQKSEKLVLDNVHDSKPKKKRKVKHQSSFDQEQNQKEKSGSNELEKTVVLGISDVLGRTGGEPVNKLLNESDQCSYTSDDDHQLIKKHNIQDREENSKEPNKKKIRKKMKLCDLDMQPHNEKAEAEAAHADKYKCHTCNRSFPTPQGLGGHKASHNKFKLVIHNTIDQIVQEPDGRGAGPNPVAHAKKSNKVVLSDSQTCRRVLDFDLNEVPRPENDEDQDQGGGGGLP